MDDNEIDILALLRGFLDGNVYYRDDENPDAEVTYAISDLDLTHDAQGDPIELYDADRQRARIAG